MEGKEKENKTGEGQDSPAKTNGGSKASGDQVPRPKDPVNSRKQTSQTRKQSKEERKIEKEEEDELEKEHFIVAVKKLKNPEKYGDCQYSCEVCSLALERLGNCRSHINGKAHKKHLKTRGRRLKMRNLQQPSATQLSAVEALLDPMIIQQGLDPTADLPIRLQIAKDIEAIICSIIPGSSVSLYGSSLTCFGFKSSDVNLDLSVPDEVPIPQALLTALEIIQKNDNCLNVKDEFDNKVPQIIFVHKKTGLSCELSCGNGTAYSTSSLLKRYADFDPVVRRLVIAFRYWAKVCSIDKQEEGSLPSYAFGLMVIHFLQRIKPPVLPKLDIKEKKAIKQSVQPYRLGYLWFKLFRYYCVEFDAEELYISIRSSQSYYREDKKWGRRRFAIEDPFSSSRRKNVASSLSSDKVFEYIMECFYTSFIYFGTLPGDGSKASTSQLVPSWYTTIKDSPKPKRAPDNKDTASTDVKEGVDGVEVGEEHETDGEGDMSSADDSTGEGDAKGKPSHQEGKEKGKGRGGSQEGEEDIFEMDDLEDGSGEVPVASNEAKSKDNSNDIKVDDQADTLQVGLEKLAINETETQIVYKFEARILTGGLKPEVTCCYCKRDGHVRNKCPDLRQQVIRPLPRMTSKFLEVVDMICIKARATLAFLPREVAYREGVLLNLEEYIQEIFPDCQLHLFGSSVNGFGFKESDLDICMTIDGKAKEDIDCISIITQLAKKMKQHRDVRNVLAITTAKVPIVKFFLRSVGREGDISLYNILALENSRMLRKYTEIDDRVSVLGYTIKLFAKVCDIGDASKGSLSSYAYMLLLLNYLQKRQPPVVPVLQELYKGARAPQHMVEGWNCWYFNDLGNLRNFWTSQNKESVGSLWLGFLRYYSETFDWEHDVICCRRTKRLSKFEKMWTKHVFAIEDPFNLDHNLGAGITRKMATYISVAFNRGRERFGTPAIVPLQFMDEYFFDADFLTAGAYAPSDRNCRVCGRIGHLARDCSLSQKNRMKEKRREEEVRRDTDRSRLSNKPFGQVDFSPARSRAKSSPIQPITKATPQKPDNPHLSGSLPNNMSLMQSKQQATPPMQKQNSNSSPSVAEGRGLNSPHVQQELHNLAQMAAMAREAPNPKDSNSHESSNLMRPEEFLPPARPTAVPTNTNDSPVAPHPHKVRPEMPLAPGAERAATRPVSMPPDHPMRHHAAEQMTDPRMWAHRSPGTAWGPDQFGPYGAQPIPHRQRSLSESMKNEQGPLDPRRNPHGVVGSAPSHLPYASPPHVSQRFPPGMGMYGSPPGRPPMPFQLPATPPNSLEQSQMLWQQQQQQQLQQTSPFGSHMTGNQFLAMIRMVETDEQTSPPSHHNESTHLTGQDVLRKSVNPIMKSPRSEDERQLFSKLNKVRNLWSTDADCIQSQKANDVDTSTGSRASETAPSRDSPQQPQGTNGKVNESLAGDRKHAPAASSDSTYHPVDKAAEPTDETDKSTDMNESKASMKRKTFAKEEDSTDTALFNMNDVHRAFSPTSSETGFKFGFPEPSFQFETHNEHGQGREGKQKDTSPQKHQQQPRGRRGKGKGRKDERPGSASTKNDQKGDAEKDLSRDKKGVTAGDRGKGATESSDQHQAPDNRKRLKGREYQRSDKNEKQERAEKTVNKKTANNSDARKPPVGTADRKTSAGSSNGNKTSPGSNEDRKSSAGSSSNKKSDKKVSAGSNSEKRTPAGSSGGESGSDNSKVKQSPGGRGKGRGRGRGKGRGQGQPSSVEGQERRDRSKSAPVKRDEASSRKTTP